MSGTSSPDSSSSSPAAASCSGCPSWRAGAPRRPSSASRTRGQKLDLREPMARSKKDAAAMPVAAFVGDHHSGGGYVNRGIDDSQFSMAQVKDWAVANKVELVALLGDYADKQRNRSSAIVPLRTQLEQIRDAGIDVGFIQGNHDFDSPPWLSGGGFF